MGHPARLLLLSLSLALSAAAPPPAHAQVGVRIQQVSEGDVRVDGMLREWRRIRRVSLGRGDDGSARFSLGYDARGLYVAATVRDERLIRTRRPGRQEDALVLTLAVPASRGRWQGREIWLFAGVEGRSAGSAASGGARGRLRPIRGARVVEARSDEGYELEAFVPWAAVPSAARWREDGRIAVRLQDVDMEARPEVENAPATAPVDWAHLDRLPRAIPAGGEHDVIAEFLQRQGMPGRRPKHDLRGDVSGDGRPERVLQVGRFLLVLGAGYRGGEGYDFTALPVRGESDVLAARLMDLTGDGKAELMLRLRQRDDAGNSRDLWQLYRFPGERVDPFFAIELRKETSAGHVEAHLRVQRAGRGAPRIEVRAGRAQGLSPESFREAPASDAEGILLPWGPVLARTYRWDGRRFETVRERANPNPWDPEAERREAQRESRESNRASRASRAARRPDVDALLAAVREARGIPRSARPRFQRDVNLAESPAPERLVVYGDGLVVVGPAFRGGEGYFHYGVSVASPEDLVDVRTADLTGDGRQEVLLFAKQRLGEITRTLLLVHQFTRDGGFPRLLAVEVGREQGRQRVTNEVQTRGGRLVVRPGRARGWDAESWPWAASDGSDGVEPLLLPWSDRSRTYRYRGGRLVR